MFQTYVVRERDNNLTGLASYRVLDCFQVEIDLTGEYYNGRRVYRCTYLRKSTERAKTGCVLFSKDWQQKGSYISLRAALGIKKAGLAA